MELVAKSHSLFRQKCLILTCRYTKIFITSIFPSMFRTDISLIILISHKLGWWYALLYSALIAFWMTSYNFWVHIINLNISIIRNCILNIGILITNASNSKSVMTQPYLHFQAFNWFTYIHMFPVSIILYQPLTLYWLLINHHSATTTICWCNLFK